MNNKKTISYLIDIDDNLIDDYQLINNDDYYNFDIYLKRTLSQCPCCGSTNIIARGNTTRKIVGSQYNNKPSIYTVHLKKLSCKDCLSPFNDSNHLAYASTKFSRQTIVHILDDLKRYNMTYAFIGDKYGVSRSQIMNIFDTFIQVKRKKLPRVLLMDEFYFSRHSKYKYSFMMMNFENGLIVDIVESRQHQFLSDYFYKIDLDERKNVEFICIDMYSPYKSIVNIFFKNSTLLVDHFHVIKLINDQLNHTRKRIMSKHQHNKRSIEYRLLKHRYRLLLKSFNNIDDETFRKDRILDYTCTQRRVLDELLKIDIELYQAYQLKELYLEFNQTTKAEINKKDMEKELNNLINKFLDSGVKESTLVGKTLRNWKKEILNSFVWINTRRISNGMIEGKNNYVKKILTNANGMQNFERARNRLIYSQNKYETYTLTPKDKDLIKTFKTKKK